MFTSSLILYSFVFPPEGEDKNSFIQTKILLTPVNEARLVANFVKTWSPVQKRCTDDSQSQGQ